MPASPADAPIVPDRAGKSTVPQLTDNWKALCEQEGQAIAERRRLACQGAPQTGDDSAQALPRVGLALSGGGVRSATFALGRRYGKVCHAVLEVVSHPERKLKRQPPYRCHRQRLSTRHTRADLWQSASLSD